MYTTFTVSFNSMNTTVDCGCCRLEWTWVTCTAVVLMAANAWCERSLPAMSQIFHAERSRHRSTFWPRACSVVAHVPPSTSVSRRTARMCPPLLRN